MPQAKHGDTVRVSYKCTTEDGVLFDASIGNRPFEFTIGDTAALPTIDEAVKGMSPGQSRTVSILSEAAYGPHVKPKTVPLDRTALPPNSNPSIGQRLQITQPDGARIEGIVTSMAQSKIAIREDHPLAGKHLVFDIKLEEIV